MNVVNSEVRPLFCKRLLKPSIVLYSPFVPCFKLPCSLCVALQYLRCFQHQQKIPWLCCRFLFITFIPQHLRQWVQEEIHPLDTMTEKAMGFFAVGMEILCNVLCRFSPLTSHQCQIVLGELQPMLEGSCHSPAEGNTGSLWCIFSCLDLYNLN